MLINLNNVYFNSFETLERWTFVLILKKSMVITLLNITCLILGLIVILCACGWFIIREMLTNTLRAFV